MRLKVCTLHSAVLSNLSVDVFLELEALGMDRLKEGLEAIGLKCGGTLSERAQRLWSVRGKKVDEIPNKLKVKRSADDLSSHEDVSSRQEVISANVFIT
jgi:splicing factor 3A subunit 3